jgi:hypothetical protein
VPRQEVRSDLARLARARECSLVRTSRFADVPRPGKFLTKVETILSSRVPCAMAGAGLGGESAATDKSRDYL